MIKSLIKIAEAEVGTTESPRGSNKVKYWSDMNSKMNGQPWCQCFLNWVFVKAFGTEDARKLLNQPSWTYYTPTAAKAFKDKSLWHSTPEKGDVIYFKNTSRICHVGLVVDVTSTTVTTIEGNTSKAGFDSNGGGVYKKTYKLTYSGIAGYGRPPYSTISPGTSEDKSVLKTEDEIVAEVIAGKWGTGNSRKSKLTKAGYDYASIQAKVNAKLKEVKK